MPNPIKYNASNQTLALKEGNYWIGGGDVGKGPTSTTDYWNGIAPPRGGYTIYLNKGSNGPSIYVASGDTELITFTNKIAGTSYSTVAECFNYYVGQTDKMVFNRDYDAVITNGLVLNLDAGFVSSYPIGGLTWYDISSGVNNGTLVNGPTFSSTNGGSIVFDSVDDYATVPYNSNLDLVNTVSLETWVKYTTTSNTVLIEKSNDNTHYQLQIFNSSQGSPGIAGQLVFMLQPNSNNWVTSGVVTNDGNWHHVVGTYDRSSTTARIYIDGVLKNTNSSITTGPTSNTQPLLIGSRSSVAGFGGSISNIKIYNRVLSSNEVLNNFRFGSQIPFTGCKTCKDIITSFPHLAGYDGLYWVYPSGSTSSPYQVYCDMTTDGGGWTLIARSAPSVNLNGKNWGWKGGSVGSINDFSQAYQLGWGEIWHGNATFTSFIFGNQRTNADNSWGPFIYKVSSIDYSTFFNSDTQQSYTNSTIKSNTAVYGTADFPGMQQAVGYTTTGTNNNIYYMRDCCGFTSLGGGWGGMSTVYCGANFYYSGPWCGGETTTGGVYDFNTYTSNGLTYGGTQHYMIMVK